MVNGTPNSRCCSSSPRTEIVATRKHCCGRIFGRSLAYTTGHHHHQRPVFLQNLRARSARNRSYRGFEGYLHTLGFRVGRPIRRNLVIINEEVCELHEGVRQGLRGVLLPLRLCSVQQDDEFRVIGREIAKRTVEITPSRTCHPAGDLRRARLSGNTHLGNLHGTTCELIVHNVHGMRVVSSVAFALNTRSGMPQESFFSMPLKAHRTHQVRRYYLSIVC